MAEQIEDASDALDFCLLQDELFFSLLSSRVIILVIEIVKMCLIIRVFIAPILYLLLFPSLFPFIDSEKRLDVLFIVR